MPCFRPLKAYRRPGGGVAFDSKAGYSDRPLDLPCGQCGGCRGARARAWSLRCVHEAALHAQNSFVTLTYSPSMLPEDSGLHVEHWQKFAKRLRKRIGSFRFFMCGEYGEEDLRPHWHALLFGVDFSGDRVLFKPGLYTSELLAEVWGKGFCTIGDVSRERAEYVARYCLKKVKLSKASPDSFIGHYDRVDPSTGEVVQVRPEFATMSRRPGVGSDWFDRFGGDVFPADEVVHEGKKFRPPRFYDERLSDSDLVSVKDKRRRSVRRRIDELSPERLRVRERVADVRLNSLKRNAF